ncbi:hypothetical protein CHUAL_003883 [Chamberlinius hualienensis]
MAFKLTYLLLLLTAAHYASAGWQTVWEDDFNGPAGGAPDSTKWGHDVGGWGWGNNELEYYTSSTNNAQLDGNGFLNIIARNDDAGQHSCWYGSCRFTSARLLTKGKFDRTYGRFEARIKLPKGKGIWPAFWLLGVDIDAVKWPTCGEIDIVEMKGSEPNTVSGTIHGPGYEGGSGLTSRYSLPSGTFNDDFHVFAIEWFSDRITWFVDGREHKTTKSSDIPSGAKWVFDHQFFILMTLAVGGHFPGDPDGSTSFPQHMTVDYVRVFNWV